MRLYKKRSPGSFADADKHTRGVLSGCRDLVKKICGLGHPSWILRIHRQRVAMQTLRRDISYALRQMLLSPVFTLTAMLTLALCIGATTAIFSMIHSVMLKSLPVVAS